MIQYQRLKGLAAGVFVDRNTKYGDAFTEWGVLGAIVELTTISARLRQMIRNKPFDTGEMKDKFIDSINYGVIGLMMLEENNWTGVEK